jgi:hypothetical protein
MLGVLVQRGVDPQSIASLRRLLVPETMHRGLFGPSRARVMRRKCRPTGPRSSDTPSRSHRAVTRRLRQPGNKFETSILPGGSALSALHGKLNFFAMQHRHEEPVRTLSNAATKHGIAEQQENDDGKCSGNPEGV